MASTASTVSGFLIPKSTSLGRRRRGRLIRKGTSIIRIRQSQECGTLEPENLQDGKKENRNVISLEANGSPTPFPQKILQHNLPPLVRALRDSASKNVASFHFPGHNRGWAAPPSMTQLIGIAPFLHDLPELPELGDLFSPGPILEAQKLAAKLFGSTETWFLVGGTTCGIQAAIMATCSPGDFIILPRNSHMSAISGIILSGAVPKYIYPEYNYDWDIMGGVTPSEVEAAFKELESEGQKASAVFVTSPTYHGICSNLVEISKICHFHGIPLIVDEAHGAHFGFHPNLPKSAMQQGADISVQSTHKVLCSLTQSSMLHLSGNIVDREKICTCLQTLQSSSLSHLLLASLDAARAQLSENSEAIFSNAVDLAVQAKDIIQNIPCIEVLDLPSFPNFPAMDILRLTIGFSQLGLSGYIADELLYEDSGIVPELVGTHSITCAINLGTCEDHLQRLVTGIRNLSAKVMSSETHNLQGRTVQENRNRGPFEDIVMGLTPRDAFFSKKKRMSIEESLGKICGELICPYPPGIPVMIPGEIITETALLYLMKVRRNCDFVSGASDPRLSSLLVCNV